MVVIGVICTLFGLLLPALNQSRQSATDIRSLSNIRQIGIAVTGYSDDNRGSIPVLYPPMLGFLDEGPAFEFETEWGNVPGFWFLHTSIYQVALDERLPAEVVFAPGRMADGSSLDRIFRPDYFLSEVFYADPVYWNRFTQQGPSQWAGQRLHAVRFPSDKGFIYQGVRHDATASGAPAMACCTPDLPPAAVLWSDLSAEALVIGTLAPGEPNFFHHSTPGYGSLTQNGAPVVQTRDGILGRDR